MTYRANIVPTMGELSTGALEPTSKAFKGYVGMVRFAPFYVMTFALMGLLASSMGLAPLGVVQALTQSLAYGALMAAIGILQVGRTRKPSVEQIRRLTRLVELDPSLAPKVNALSEKDYTFKKLGRFILENSARANQVEMDQALDMLDDAVNGRT